VVVAVAAEVVAVAELRVERLQPVEHPQLPAAVVVVAARAVVVAVAAEVVVWRLTLVR
jgi:hypothetical protein